MKSYSLFKALALTITILALSSLSLQAGYTKKYGNTTFTIGDEPKEKPIVHRYYVPYLFGRALSQKASCKCDKKGTKNASCPKQVMCKGIK